MTGAPAIAVVDYGMGNRRSVQKALEHLGAEVWLSADPAAVERAEGLVIPGVGAFPLAMERLRRLGLEDPIRARAAAGVPLLGICLGMQLLFEGSEEIAPTAGLGLIPGRVAQLRTGALRLPHIGWSEVRFARSTPLLAGLPDGGCPFYHVHSFAAHPRDEGDLLASTEYGEEFATIVGRGNVFGVQFHPEKSSTHGLALLGNFLALCAARTGPSEVAAAAGA